MSRIGEQAITLPSSVKLAFNDNKVSIDGAKGKLEYTLPSGISLTVDNDKVLLARESDEADIKALHGLARSLVNNMIIGVKDGFKKELEIRGVGYKATMKGKNLILNIGFSHTVEYTPLEGVTVTTPKPTSIIIEGYDKQAVGQTAATIRAYKKPEPYKGKGIRYVDEFVPTKEGKRVG